MKMITAKREKDHKDLVLTLADDNGKVTHKIIIENKVKSWLDLKQLSEYSRKEKGGQIKPVFILLSMTAPPDVEAGKKITDDNGEYWLYLSYVQLADRFIQRLSKIAATESNAYLSALLDDYASMITNMTQLLERDLFPNGKGEGALGLLKPIQIKELAEKLKDPCKLNAIFEKVLFERYEAMAARIMEGYPASSSSIPCNRGMKDEDIPQGTINISSGYSSSGQTGYLTFSYRCYTDIVIGVQIEGGQYRHFISHVTKGKSVKEYVDSYFNAPVGAKALPQRWVTSSNKELDAPVKNSTYLEYYSFENEHFLYLHASVDDRPMTEILEVAVKDILWQAGQSKFLVPRNTKLTPGKKRGS